MPNVNTINYVVNCFYVPLYIFREKGGVEAERAERERWITREQQKIMESVNGKATAVPRN